MYVGSRLGQLLIMQLFFFFFFILFKFSLLPPTRQHSNTLLSSHTSPVQSGRFASSFIISSILPMIASMNALRAEFIPFLSVFLHISDASLGRARHMEMES